MRVLLFDFGTYCDFKLVYVILKALTRRGHHVTHVTDIENRAFARQPGVNTVLYTVPARAKDLMQDPKVVNDTTDDQRPVFRKFLSSNSRQIAYFFMVTEKRQLHDLWTQGDLVLLHYPALSFVGSMPAEVLRSAKVCVFYVAPGYPNCDMPWVFSQTMHDPNQRLRDPTQRDHNLKSTLQMWNQQSLMNFSSNAVMELMQRAQIVALWDPKLMPWPKTPFRITKTGALLDRDALSGPFEVDPVVRAFVKRSGLLMYFTLGSFSMPVYSIIKGLLATDPSLRILYHDTKKLAQNFPELLQIAQDQPSRLMIFTGFVPHEYIVPKCAVIGTTGSICLVNVALYYGVPYINIPMLNEQFMWAKNYKERAGVPYIDLPVALSTPDPDLAIAVMAHNAIEAVRSPKTRAFTNRVKKSVRERDGVALLVKAIEKQGKSKPH